ncbi:MAG: dephospho-CoA kinase [Thermoleophilia bacterium]|nr:dephospho-CoA kinase [Thermoleophilia bacterium]
MSQPVAVAITGGIGAGKSTVLAAFRGCGAATVSSDEIVHHLLRSDLAVRAALVERLGEEILDEEGIPDRPAIAAIVFADADALAFLEGLLHPLVSREYLTWYEQLGRLDEPPLVCATEVPLLYESGGESRFDRVVVVTAPRQLREQRRHAPQDSREDRLLDDGEKIAKADFHYVNTGTFDDLETWVEGVMADLTSERSDVD